VLDLLRTHPFLAIEEPTTVVKLLAAVQVQLLFVIFDLSVGRILQPMRRLNTGNCRTVEFLRWNWFGAGLCLLFISLSSDPLGE